jgi:hypothetical protein
MWLFGVRRRRHRNGRNGHTYRNRRSRNHHMDPGHRYHWSGPHRHQKGKLSYQSP